MDEALCTDRHASGTLGLSRGPPAGGGTPLRVKAGLANRQTIQHFAAAAWRPAHLVATPPSHCAMRGVFR